MTWICAIASPTDGQRIPPPNRLSNVSVPVWRPSTAAANIYCQTPVLTFRWRWLHIRAGWTAGPHLIEFRWVEVSGLRFYFGVFMQRGFQLGRIFLLLLVQFLQVGFQRGDVFSEGLGPGVLGILMRWPAVSCPG